MALVFGLLAPAPSMAGGVARFSAHLISPPVIISAPRLERVSGGRMYSAEESFVVCYRSDEPDHARDFVTGCWYFYAYRYIYPDGTQLLWGRSEQQDLQAFPNGQGVWIAEFTGQWVPGAPNPLIMLDITACGRGALKGWTLTSRPDAATETPLEVGQDDTWIR
jgi:hypothetical protein